MKGYFKQDDDSHWYFIPSEKAERFDHLMWEEPDEELFFEEGFDSYSMGGGIGDEEIIRVPEEGMGQVSDGYHTFDELYEHRCLLFMMVMCANPKWSWVSKKHHDNSEWDGWFIAGFEHPYSDGITYHLPNKYWDMIPGDVVRRDKAPEWDGHTSEDVLDRIKYMISEHNTNCR